MPQNFSDGKVPSNIVFTKENKEKILPFKDVVYDEKDFLRECGMPDPVLRRPYTVKRQLLSHGYRQGYRYSRWKN